MPHFFLYIFLAQDSFLDKIKNSLSPIHCCNAFFVYKKKFSGLFYFYFIFFWFLLPSYKIVLWRWPTRGILILTMKAERAKSQKHKNLNVSTLSRPSNVQKLIEKREQTPRRPNQTAQGKSRTNQCFPHRLRANNLWITLFHILRGMYFSWRVSSILFRVFRVSRKCHQCQTNFPSGNSQDAARRILFRICLYC